MSLNSPTATPQKSGFKQFWLALGCLAVVLGLLFAESFSTGKIHFSNDGPLGMNVSQEKYSLSNFTGAWHPLNWLGTELVASPPNISNTFSLVLGAVLLAKFFPPLCLLTLGLCSWLFFRRLRFAPSVALLGAFAVMLNSDYFSVACWGVAEQALCLAMSFLALAALADPSPRHRLIRLVLAGFAVGSAVMEGFDVGAILSVCVASFALFQSWNTTEGTAVVRLTNGCFRVGLVAVCAALISAQTLSSLIGTQIKGVVGTDQDAATKESRWVQATIWSLPKAETFQIFIPGIFGYRMDTPDGGQYWGTIGAPPASSMVEKLLSSPNEAERAQGASLAANYNAWRFSGGGIYAGVLVVVIGLWAICQSFRRTGSVFADQQRRSIWFWLGLAIVGLLLAYGKYAPFYRLFYSLPYASTIRNPAKFIHVFNWAWTILFAYGLQGIFKHYLNTPLVRASGVMDQFKAWLGRAPAFDRTWVKGCIAAVGLAIVGLLIYGASSSSLQRYMVSVGIPASEAPNLAKFSASAVTWFVFLFALTVGSLMLIFSGQFTGARARYAPLLLGLILVGDLARADLPWILYWDYPYKYATNPVIDSLRDKAWEHRVVIWPFKAPNQETAMMMNLYNIEWNQHLFPYYSIQTLDLIQEPRESVDNNVFRAPFPPYGNSGEITRLWQLTNTRYIIGPAGAEPSLNAQLDPVEKRFKTLLRFSLAGKNGNPTGLTDLTARPDPNGPLAVIDYTAALPRAKLFSNWQVEPTRTNTMSILISTNFDPLKTVVVDRALPTPPAGLTNDNPGTVEINTNYTFKRIELAADVKTASVLLLNERVTPKWQVFVDGKQQEVLQCNYLMRGVYLTPGKHTVVFQFATQYKGLLISLGTILVGFALIGFLVFSKKPAEEPEGVGEAGKPAPAPKNAAKK